MSDYNPDHIIAMVDIYHIANNLILALATQESGKNHFLIDFTLETLKLLEEAANEHGALVEHRYFVSKNQFIEFAALHELLGKTWIGYMNKCDRKFGRSIKNAS
jgi:hypothetical protein